MVFSGHKKKPCNLMVAEPKMKKLQGINLRAHLLKRIKNDKV